jgi:peptide/nickel transport system permease protein
VRHCFARKRLVSEASAEELAVTAYIIRRLLQMIPLIFGVTFLTFALINLIPGSPVARLRDNPKIRPEAAIELERQLGLDKP